MSMQMLFSVQFADVNGDVDVDVEVEMGVDVVVGCFVDTVVEDGEDEHDEVDVGGMQIQMPMQVRMFM